MRLKSADPAEMPLIDPNYWADPYDREMSIRGLGWRARSCGSRRSRPTSRARCCPGPASRSDDQLVDYACRTAKTDHHPVGTCKMGMTAWRWFRPTSRCRGIEGLRICDASIMPRVPSSNTNAPTIMVGEKGADLIIGREPLPPAVFSGNRAAA